MKNWDIWSEGYVISGNESQADFFGTFPGDTFNDAVMAFKHSTSGRDADLINVEKMTYWGCRLFDNEIDARKSFG